MPRRKSEAESASAPSSTAVSNRFPIVGVGASAGGLEALEQFLRPVPTDSGMAFVIVQHLDPTHPALLTELLQRTTGLMVEQVIDRVKVRPNHVYVIPPNHDLSLLHGSLHLFEPSAPRGLRLPIDVFFRSMVEDQQERSIGIVLSGMGSDGALGLKAIKEVGGVTLVQEPSTAKFDAMPRNAIDAHLADIIAPPEKLYELLATHLGHAINHQDLDHTINHQDLGHTTNHQDPSASDPVVILLRAHSGHDFSQYKRSTLYRRIERRMGLHRLDKIAHYVRYLQENPQEVELLFKELLIGVTHFFRDSAAWIQLQQQVLPVLLADHPTGGRLRAWSTGCATGEEAYSLAILFKETLQQLHPPQAFSLQIFATDLEPGRYRRSPPGRLPGAYCQRCVAGATSAIFHQGSQQLPDQRRDSRDGHLRAAERDHGPAFYQTGSVDLPQPADLPDRRVTDQASVAVSLQPQSGGISVSGFCGNHWPRRRTV